MSPKLSKFVVDNGLQTPFVVHDMEIVADNFHRFNAGIPGCSVFYAVKANPALPILRLLVSLGSCFDAASIEEVRLCLKAGASPERISFGNTVKKESSIRESYECGVRLFAFDSIEELEKIARSAPGSRVYCRLLVGNDGAQWPLSRKFGCAHEMAFDLMLKAKSLGLKPDGLSFHVGSQQLSPLAYSSALRYVSQIHKRLVEADIAIAFVNVGGGFPVQYREQVPSIDVFGDEILATIGDLGLHNLHIMCEPGRYIVANAGIAVSEVVLTSRKSENDDVRWVYLDIGRFGGLAETEGEAICYDIQALDVFGQEGPVVLAGPSCDSVDTLYQKASYALPLALHSGHRVLISSAGAYVSSYASRGFNGFSPPADYFI